MAGTSAHTFDTLTYCNPIGTMRSSVVDDVRNGGLTKPALPTVYAPCAQASEGATNMFLTVRTAGDPLGLVAGIRERIRHIDPNQPVASIQTMEARLSASVSQRRTEMSVLAVFAVMAGLLAAIGIYGVRIE